MIWIASLYLFMLIFRPFEYWASLQNFYIERITLIILLVATAMTRDKKWHASPINACVMIVVMAIGLSTMASDSPSASFDLFYELIKFTILYYIFQYIIVDQRFLINIILGYLGVMALYVGKSAWEFFVNGRYVYRMGISRMVGIDITLGDPNSFAASIVYALPFAIMILRVPGMHPLVKRACVGYLGLSVTALLFTGSRSGQLTALLLGAMFLATSSRRMRYILPLALTLGLSWSFMPEDYQQRFLSTFDHSVGPANAAESADSRLALLESALDIFAEHPLFGVGPGMFPRHVASGLSPHSLYGQILSENGLAGSLAFLLFLVVVFLELRRCARLGRPPAPAQDAPALPGLVATAGGQTIVLLLFNGIASHNFYRFNWFFVAALAAATAGAWREQAARERRRKRAAGGETCRQSA